MSRVITFSRTFPAYHLRKGQETFFVEKIGTALQKYDNFDPNQWVNKYPILMDLFMNPDVISFPSKLLTPRVRVIVNYPGSPFKIGDILTLQNGLYRLDFQRLFSDLEKYPAVFQPLKWWECRTIEEMSEYVKNNGAINDGTIPLKETNEYKQALAIIEKANKNTELEEAAQEFTSNIVPISPVRKEEAVKYFKAGAKWKEEQSANEAIEFAKWIETETGVYTTSKERFRTYVNKESDKFIPMTFKELHELWKSKQ